MRLMLFSLLAMSLVSTSCIPVEDGEDADYRSAIAFSAEVSLDIPNDQGSTGLAVGDPSVLYEATRGVSLSVNAHVLVTLGWLQVTSLAPLRLR